ncbi:MAG TPA: tRNA (adenosine(37)-N6)-dimethylallyltransferase MiaA [Stellaceae bacterium]|nr:tRNA (adenosine(37)-N6)-dimethylallyltransferase MiaA [Stellaceae bacterium]
MRAHAEEIGQLLEHLVLDDRRLEIGDEKPFPAPVRRLNHGIDGLVANRRPRRRLGSRRIALDRDVAGHRRQPIGITAKRGGATGQRRLGSRSGDQSHDKGQSASSHKPAVVIIAGPTASGKSSLALDLAQHYGGTVINADSQQIYGDLKILSARPDEAAEARAPHRLYGFLDAAERGSVARWGELALAEIAAAIEGGRLPIVAGGTGLYLRVLMHGLASVPDIPPELRAEAAELYRRRGGPGFRDELARLDPAAAARFPPGDRTRLTRAYEVVRATGVPIAEWQGRTAFAAPYRFATLLLMPPRELIYAACDARFAAMIEAGGLDEARALMARGLDLGLPAMKAVGVPELMRHLRGEIALDDAIAAAQLATRRYAKRQMTWFRHQLGADLICVEQYSESFLHCSRHFIDRFLLTE